MMQGAATVIGFFTNLQAAWDQLLNFRPSPCCSCGKCACGVNDKITTFQHQDSLMQFLNGLNDSYSQVRTQILMMEPSPSIDKAFSLVIQEERQRYSGFNVVPLVESTTLAVKNQGNSYPGNNKKGINAKGRPVCSHCGKLGHVVEKCYKLVGFLPGYKQKGRVAMANQVLIEDDQGNFGYSGIQQVNSFPFTSKQYQQIISMLSSYHASTSGAPNDALHSANSALSGNVCNTWSYFVSLDLYHSVFAVNPVNKNAYGNDVWILDTGATDHIVHSLSLFTHITSPISTFVQLPNREKVTVTHIGTIQVTSTLKLENILCVPSFNFNLISVSQLTKTLSCCLVFLSNLCFIQDLVEKRLEWVNYMTICIC